MNAQLRAVQEALDAADAPITFFFRNDDAGWDDGALYSLLEMLGDSGVTIDLATIPAVVTSSQASRLLRFMHATHAARVHQHGYSHQNHEVGGRKCEFGAGRSIERRWADIRCGKDRLNDLFQGETDSVFTPPWNRCDADTVGILAREGFRILSRDLTATPIPTDALQEVSIAIDWQRAVDKNGQCHDPLRELAELIAGGAAQIGIMTHHATITAIQSEQLSQLVRILAGQMRVRFDTLGAMARRLEPKSVGSQK